MSEANQANKEKLANNLTGAEHGPTPKRSPKTVVKTAELAKLSHINVIAADERLKTGSEDEETNYFTMVPNELREADLSSQARWLWVELFGYCNGKDPKEERNKAHPSQETLADRLNVSVREIQRYVKELRRNGLLKVEQTKVGLNNSYFLYAPEASPDDTETQSRRQGCRPKDDKGVAPSNSADNDGHGDRGTKKTANKTNVVNKTNTLQTVASSSPDVELFATATNEQLKDKQTNNYNVNDLIAKLQTEALNADVIFKADKLRGDRRDKVRGQISDLQKNLGGSAEVVKFFEWFFSNPRRIGIFTDTKRKFKVGNMVERLDTYETEKCKNYKSRREALIIDLTGPNTQYTREDLEDFSLAELEDKAGVSSEDKIVENSLNKDLSVQELIEKFGEDEESEQSMAEARAKMG